MVFLDLFSDKRRNNECATGAGISIIVESSGSEFNIINISLQRTAKRTAVEMYGNYRYAISE